MATLIESSAAPAHPEDRPTRRFEGGWAGDLVTSIEGAWVAWSGCDDPEPPLLTLSNWESPLRREAPLQPGLTPEDWRRAASRAGFHVSLTRLGAAGAPDDVRLLQRTAHAIEGPTLAQAEGRTEPVVLWVERLGDVHTLHAARDGRMEVVAQSRGAMLGPRAVTSGSTVWVAWQQWPDTAGAGSPRIVVSRLVGDTWSPPRAVSAEGRAAWAPALAAAPDGTVWCAWDAWDGAAYQVYVAHTMSDGEWKAATQVSGASRSGYGGYYHLAPDVVAEDGRAWVVWNRSARWGEVNHRFNHHRSLHAALVTWSGESLRIEPAPGRPVMGEPGRLPVVSLPFLHSTDEEYINPQAARIELDSAGRPVVFFRQFRGAEFKDFGWTLCVVAHTGEDWTAPRQLSAATGAPEVPYGIALETPSEGGADRWLAAFHAADYALVAGLNPSKPLANHRLVVEALSLETLAPDPHSVIQYDLPFVRNPAPDIARRSTARREEPAQRELSFDGQRYELLFGDLHRHSTYSKCMSATDGDPLDHWRWVTDVAPLDFYALTEHLEYMSYLEWRRGEDLAESLAAGGVLALCGFELAIPPGHTNFFYADQRVGYDLRVACLTSATLADVWPKLDAWIPEGKVVAIRHHQGHRGNDLMATYGAKYEPLAEVIQSRGEYPDWVSSLRRQGLRVGMAGATDHARAAPIVHGLTGLWLPPAERTREGVLAGLRGRRTFATNGARLAVFLSGEDGVTVGSGGDVPRSIGMGQAGAISGVPRLTARVAGSRRVETVAFYRDNELLHVAVVDAQEGEVSYEDRDAPPGEHAYWVRVLQDREASGRRPHQGVAYSSPVWLTL